ncbi:hypothetical protein [Mucilaginibacter pineti]|uniref:hypothetical protein n=1 Tax=Mucilaginibacter pineti TaxID=1391627 RepID=UPI000B8223D9|nr:hypothetical protein [Mucilaginibacter pineti]
MIYNLTCGIKSRCTGRYDGTSAARMEMRVKGLAFFSPGMNRHLQFGFFNDFRDRRKEFLLSHTSDKDGFE